MDTGVCCVAPPAARSDDQIVPAHPGDFWNPHPGSHSQQFIDAWLQMQVSYFLFKKITVLFVL